ncbi:hypothetical protein K438DRAFT_1932701 [Mycena galopus ATCC 62051]|nr:hypothetical protein K438DRAFT_1932701 [Mycena galopus ATCC 62051]
MPGTCAPRDKAERGEGKRMRRMKKARAAEGRGEQRGKEEGGRGKGEANNTKLRSASASSASRRGAGSEGKGVGVVVGVPVVSCLRVGDREGIEDQEGGGCDIELEFEEEGMHPTHQSRLKSHPSIHERQQNKGRKEERIARVMLGWWDGTPARTRNTKSRSGVEEGELNDEGKEERTAHGGALLRLRANDEGKGAGVGVGVGAVVSAFGKGRRWEGEEGRRRRRREGFGGCLVIEREGTCEGGREGRRGRTDGWMDTKYGYWFSSSLYRFKTDGRMPKSVAEAHGDAGIKMCAGLPEGMNARVEARMWMWKQQCESDSEGAAWVFVVRVDEDEREREDEDQDKASARRSGSKRDEVVMNPPAKTWSVLCAQMCIERRKASFSCSRQISSSSLPKSAGCYTVVFSPPNCYLRTSHPARLIGWLSAARDARWNTAGSTHPLHGLAITNTLEINSARNTEEKIMTTSIFGFGELNPVCSQCDPGMTRVLAAVAYGRNKTSYQALSTYVIARTVIVPTRKASKHDNECEAGSPRAMYLSAAASDVWVGMCISKGDKDIDVKLAVEKFKINGKGPVQSQSPKLASKSSVGKTRFA